MPMLYAAAGRTDEDYVLALLRETGIPLRVRLRLRACRRSRLVPPSSTSPIRSELRSIYADIAAFTRRYLQQA
jgi:hypothetical protein